MGESSNPLHNMEMRRFDKLHTIQINMRGGVPAELDK